MSFSFLGGTKKLSNNPDPTPLSVNPNEPNIFPTLSTFSGFTEIVETDFTANTNPFSREDRNIIRKDYEERKERLPELIVESIIFSLFSSEELEAISSFEVTEVGNEGINTVNDPRSGVIDFGGTCRECQQDNLTCPGHFGFIKLKVPIIHPLMGKKVIAVLTSVCNSCSGLLLTREQINEKVPEGLPADKILSFISKYSAKLMCRRDFSHEEEICKCESNPTYISTKSTDTGKIAYTYGEGKGSDNFRSIKEIINILDNVSDEDSKLMGFDNYSHPRKFIMHSIPVIPICARPQHVLDGIIMEDDITKLYIEIVKANNALIEYYASEGLGIYTEKFREEKIKKISDNMSKIIGVGDTAASKNIKGAAASIKNRIQGKEGTVRSGLMGKRVNYSGRTVLGPDPTIKFGQVRVPYIMSKKLTPLETVGPNNIRRLTQLFNSGRVTHVIPGSGKLRNMKMNVNEKFKNEYVLTHGDQVYRFLQNGDYLMYNRQPTLHKQSMLGGEVVLGPTKTIGLHLAYTTPMNADFDGDEGNLWLPMSKEALREVVDLMNVKECIMDAQTNRNIIGTVFDSLVGSYLLTQPETIIERSLFNNIYMKLEEPVLLDSLFQRLEKYGVPKNSGRALFSVLLPEDFYYKKGDVLIREGILIRGYITKSHVGTSHGSIIQVLYKDYGTDITSDFLTNIYRMMDSYLDHRGYSIGLKNCFLLGDAEETIRYDQEKLKLLVKQAGGKLEDIMEEERREKQITAYLNTAKGIGGRLSKENLPEDNAFNIAIRSGAKGSDDNTAQVMAAIGQQFIKGERPIEQISEGQRCLPYFPFGSTDPEARGLCNNSFITGLSPAELIFHQAASRVGLMDTAIKTADTGDLHRSMVKALENVKVYLDGSVRNEAGFIYQLAYGEDGFGAENLELVETGVGVGKITSFIDMRRLAGRINSKYGFDTPGDLEPEEIFQIGSTVKSDIFGIGKLVVISTESIVYILNINGTEDTFTQDELDIEINIKDIREGELVKTRYDTLGKYIKRIIGKTYVVRFQSGPMSKYSTETKQVIKKRLKLF